MHVRQFGFLTFWLGFAGLLFLIWIWFDSRLHSSDLGRYGSKIVILSNRHATLQLAIGDNLGPVSGIWINRGGFPPDGDEVPSPHGNPPVRFFVPPGHGKFEREFGREWSIYWIPHWLILGLYLGIWGALAARNRRIYLSYHASPRAAELG